MKNSIYTVICLLLFALASAGCAVLHHAQVGEITSHPNFVYRPIDIKISESGINFEELKDTAKLFMRNPEARQGADDLQNFISGFQMGPRTGNQIFNPDYAKAVIDVLYTKCPSGKITGLTSIREMRKYPIVSGEIVKITGYCLVPKKGA